MRIAARLANVSPALTIGASFHGRNVVVRMLSEAGFEADCAEAYQVGELVRLRLPCAGVATARVIEASPGWLRCDFVNPLGRVRLESTLGVSHEVRIAALA